MQPMASCAVLCEGLRIWGWSKEGRDETGGFLPLGWQPFLPHDAPTRPSRAVKYSPFLLLHPPLPATASVPPESWPRTNTVTQSARISTRRRYWQGSLLLPHSLCISAAVWGQLTDCPRRDSCSWGPPSSLTRAALFQEN